MCLHFAYVQEGKGPPTSTQQLTLTLPVVYHWKDPSCMHLNRLILHLEQGYFLPKIYIYIYIYIYVMDRHDAAIIIMYVVNLFCSVIRDPTW